MRRSPQNLRNLKNYLTNRYIIAAKDIPVPRTATFKSGNRTCRYIAYIDYIDNVAEIR